MQTDNNISNNKFRELENQSLPDLSKMDEHWQQMGLLLQPTVPASLVKKKTGHTKFIFVTCSIAALLLLSFFAYRYFMPAKEKTPATDIITLSERSADTLPDKTGIVRDLSQPAADTPILLKARTSAGVDTVLQAMRAGEGPTLKNNSIALDKFYTQLQKKPQVFMIDNQRDTTIYGKAGTSLYIPANAFDTRSSITIQLSEFYDLSDMIAHKLSTTCDGHLLVSGGMVFLDASDKNGPLEVKKGASLRLDMPKQDNGARMELFYGDDYYRNNTTAVRDSINWKRTYQPFTDAKQTRAAIRSEMQGRKTDTVRFSDKEESPVSFDFVGKDTTPGKTILVINGDSIILQRYGVNISRLGWINCDRFYNDARPRIELVVDLGDNPDNYNTVLVFDKFAAIMPPSSRQGHTIRFLNLPEGEPARIIATGIKNGRPVTAMQQVTISKTPVGNMNFEETSVAAYKKKLSQ